jgi:putative hydrolase of the HAD superfamily
VKKLKAVLFDLDDTLYPEREYVLSGFEAVASWAKENLGINDGFEKLKELSAQGVRGDTFDRWLKDHHLPLSLVPNLVQVYREHQPRLKPYPEVKPLLEALRSDYLIGLISDGYLTVQMRKFTSLELADYFDTVIFSDEFGRDAWKPSIHPFQVALTNLACVGPEAVYVGDNPEKDFFGARRLGMKTVWIRRPDCEYTSRNPPTFDHAPHQTLVVLDDLPQSLLSLECST